MGSGAWTLPLVWTLESVLLPLYGVVILARSLEQTRRQSLEGVWDWEGELGI